MTSQEAKGSFMQYLNVLLYFDNNNHDSDNLWASVVDIDGRPYLPTQIVSNRITNGQWQRMRDEVDTYVFGQEHFNVI